MRKPVLQLCDYQKAWLSDQSRFKMGMFARQTGKTLVATLEIVEQVLKAAAEGKRSDWLIVSASERQSQNALVYVRKHLYVLDRIFQQNNNAYLEDRTENKHEIVLPNGSSILSLPCNPDTIRGYTRHVYADEFAFYEDGEGMWKALFAVCSNGKMFRITSTPNGKGNRFYRLFNEEDNGWTKHRVDIHLAIEQGLNRNVTELQKAMNDPDAWAQEFELQWLDEATAWLPYSLIAQCEANFLGVYDPANKNPCYVGIDIGRRHDLFVLWVLEQQGEILYQRRLIAEKGISFAQQEAYLAEVVEKFRPQRICIDQTGMGEQFTERARTKYGDYTVEGVLFTSPIKLDLANLLRRSFEDQQVKIWSGDKVLRDDLHALKRTTTTAGNVRFVADRNENGHADRAWALALALHAAQEPPQIIEYETVEADEWASGLRWDA